MQSRNATRRQPRCASHKTQEAALVRSIKFCQNLQQGMQHVEGCCTSAGAARAAQVHAPDKSSLLCCSAASHERSQLEHHHLHKHRYAMQQ